MAEIKRSLAVVIGIDQYSNGIPALQTPVNDAKEIAATLESKYEYQVVLMLDGDANNDKFNSLLRAFEQEKLLLSDGSQIEIEETDRLFFYFAGHGIALDTLDNADGPRGFLVPQDARMDNNSTLLSMMRLHDALQKLPCRHLLIILDCCFAGAFCSAGNREAVLQNRLYRERYDRFISRCAQQVITSASDDEKAADYLYPFGQRSEHDGHSPFAEFLLKALRGEINLFKDGVLTVANKWATQKHDKKAVGLLWNNDPRLPLVQQLLKSDVGWLNLTELEFVKRSIQKRRNMHLNAIAMISAVMILLSQLTAFGFIQLRFSIVNNNVEEIRRIPKVSNWQSSFQSICPQLHNNIMQIPQITQANIALYR